MKNLLFFVALIACAVIPVSCLTTLQPLVTSVNIIQDNRISGQWQSDAVAGKGVTSTIEINNDKNDSSVYSKTYGIVFRQNGIKHAMSGALTRIGDNLYIQLMPLAIEDPAMLDGSGYEYTFDYVPAFSIGKVSFEHTKLSIQFLNGEYIKELINTGRVRIKHEKEDLFGSFLITASSDELKQFLEKYGDDDRLYSTSTSLSLTRN